jgi:hypothetical protein
MSRLDTKSALALFAIAITFTGCGGAKSAFPSGSELRQPQMLDRMSVLDRLRAARPSNLASGTRIFHPVAIKLESPGEILIIAPSTVLKRTSTEIVVAWNGGERHFPLSTTKVTDGVTVRELYVPPDRPVPNDAGAFVETVP